MKDIKIFVSHPIDRAHETINNILYVPVRCGAVFDTRKNIKMSGDHTGENISEKCMSYGDLTVVYWAWKNVEADYYGFCNYQRYFAFPVEREPEDSFGNINCEFLTDKIVNRLGLDATDRIYQEILLHDFILAVPINVQNGEKRFENLFKYYEFVRGKPTDDLERVLQIINSKYPEYSDYARVYLNGHNLYSNNLFIMTRELFYEYCNWMFYILTEFEKQTNRKNDSIKECHCVYQVGELLLGIFCSRLILTKSKLRNRFLQRILIKDTNCTLPPLPYFSERNIPIVMASSEFFLPYAGVTIQSIIEHSSYENNYDIILLNTGYSKQTYQQLDRLLASYPNFSIRLLNVEPYISKLKFNIVGHVSQETFYRLLVPELFYNYQKIVYLDSDLVVCEDIVHLFQIDIQDNLIAGAYDADFIGEYNGASPSIKTYCDEKLCLEDPYSYVQAGVLLFNITAMKNTFHDNELIEFASGKTLNFVDQDVLNYKCSGRVKILDMRWNVVTDCGGYRVDKLIRRAPSSIYQQYLSSRGEPKIIHYSGFEKPWTNPSSDMSEIYWNYARKSVFYELIIDRMKKNEVHSFYELLRYSLKNLWKPILNFFFPRYSTRREELKKIYYKLFRHA